MSDLQTIRTALERCYDSIEGLCASLDDAEWATQSLCPDWTVRGVVSHLAGVEEVLSGWLPDGVETPPPFERAGAFARETSDLDNSAFAARVGEVFSVRRRDLAGLSEGDLERPSWMPTGPGVYGRFLSIRVFDFWVHERDITTPLGRETDDTGLCAEMALGEVAGSLGYIVGKKVGFPDGRGITFRLTGPVERYLSVVVEGRAKIVEHIEKPDVELVTDSVTFVQLACGRIDPQGPIDDGTVSWTGDAELGELAARNLRYTM